MPKGILEFSLPEESVEHMTSLHAPQLAAVIRDFDSWLRSKHKYENVEMLSTQDVRSKLWDFVKEYDIPDGVV